MEKVKFELRNCYGISKLDMELPFNKVDSYGNLINAHIIYAPNGTMKTSLTDTIKDIQMKRQSMDFYYPERTTIRKVNEVLDDGTERELVEDDVLVIDSYDAQYKSEKMSTLLVNSVLKEKYERIYGGIISKYDQLINLLKKESGIKNEIESIITTDFNVPIKSIYDLFVEVAEKYTDFSESTLDTIKYSQVFNKDTLKVFDNPEFTKLIEEYIISYESLLVNNPVFKKSFNHTAAEVVVSSLSKNGFFKANHKVILDGTSDKLDEKEFIKKVEEAKTLVLAQPEMTAKFNSLDALFSNAGGRDFRELLVRSKSLILELADLKELKRKLWISHIMKHQELFQELVLTYTNGKKELDSISKKALEEITIWDNVIEQYNERFTNMPFELYLKNQEDVILKGSVTATGFRYKDRNKQIEIEQETLLKRLSNGEKRALYLLNIIFEIKARVLVGKEILLIIDDIADSFDYRNKYAIIEYLKEIVDNSVFKTIILTHNFDFYRTVSCRLNLKATSHFALKNETEIVMKNGEYHENVFAKWKSHIYSENRFFVSSIPFIRNLVEYTKGTECEEYKMLTSLLHYKKYPIDNVKCTDDIQVKDLTKLYKDIWGACGTFAQDENVSVKQIIFEQAEGIIQKQANPIKIENKIVLSIAIRMIAEIYMINRINNRNQIESIAGNQTRELKNITPFNREDGDDKKRVELIEKVLIITSENIHLNSFMYEPIIDISLEELKNLYIDIKSL